MKQDSSGTKGETMKWLRAAAPITLALSLAGCATGFQSNGFTGGFSDFQMAQDVYRISFRGNAFTSSDATTEMAMLRAAQLTLEAGYSHFAVMNEGESYSTTYIAQPGSSTTMIQPNGAGGYNAWTHSNPGALVPVNKPRSEIVVRMFHDGSSGGMDARQVFARLAPRYAPNAIMPGEPVYAAPAPAVAPAPAPAPAPLAQAQPAAPAPQMDGPYRLYKCGELYTTRPKEGQGCVPAN